MKRKEKKNDDRKKWTRYQVTSAIYYTKEQSHIDASLSHIELTIVFRGNTRPENRYGKLILFLFSVLGKHSQEIENKGTFVVLIRAFLWVTHF